MFNTYGEAALFGFLSGLVVGVNVVLYVARKRRPEAVEQRRARLERASRLASQLKAELDVIARREG